MIDMQEPANHHRIQFRTNTQLRLDYLPSAIGVRMILAFLVESMPASGKFFYRDATKLNRAVHEVFERMHLVEAGLSTLDFLRRFQELGCYVDDLCSEPVNRMADTLREARRQEGIGPLATRLIGYQPTRVIIAMKKIEDPVREACRSAGIQGRNITPAPFPAYSARNVSNFQEIVSDVLRVMFP
jgi:hypothetical protein